MAFPDTDALALYGHAITLDLVTTISESIFCSAYGICFAIALYSIFRRGFTSRVRLIMLFVVIYLYAASVAQWALDMRNAFVRIHSLLMVPDVAIADRAYQPTAKYSALQVALFMFNMVIGDAVVIWRTWAIYQRVWSIVLQCICLLATFVFALADVICTSNGNIKTQSADASKICPLAEGTAWTLSIVINITCTKLIGWKAWRHRKMMQQLFPGKTGKMSGEKTLWILVESGFVYSLLWTIVFFCDARYHWDYASQVFTSLARQMAGMYPTLIIVIVNLQRTVWEEPLTDIVGTGAVSRALQWAPNSNGSAMTDTFRTERGEIHPDAGIGTTRETPVMQ
ncbi:hypothetical protein MSAN_01088600 [Mycena sanguinolenta]|uniref:Uncharacterized protein n=1 Tax=Mycena sanguinolenta TaxID=230812 RepID=A0A8H7D9A2_9AGAR|nr:hypothetical protein MSAN_01088600 [Mycena sanguinolenta]